MPGERISQAPQLLFVLAPLFLDLDPQFQVDLCAQQILDAAGVRGGLVVQLGCSDGKLTAALGAGDGIVVQGLDTDPANVARARRRIHSLGLGARASADLFDGERLPYEAHGMLRSRANTIEGGTTEVNKNIVAERVLGLPREPK